MKKILSLLLVTSSIFSMQLDLVKSKIKPESVFAPSKLGSVELYHGNKGFYVHQDNKKHVIKKYFTDPIIRDITKKQLNAFLEGGYFSLNQMEDGEFSLKAKGRINGGGPIFGTFMYWVTKSLCYATAVAATSAIAVSGGSIGFITNGVAATSAAVITGTAATTTTITAIGTTAGVVVGTGGAGAIVGGTAGILGAAVGGTSAASTAGLVTAAAVTSTGSVAATVAAVETISVAVGTFFGMAPTP